MKLAFAVCLLFAATTASAQSKRYPPTAPDKDLEAEQRSELWESTLDPEVRPYRQLVRDAQRLLGSSNPDDQRVALEKLDAAVKVAPKQDDAYALRGAIYLAKKEWAKCAADFGAAEDYTTEDPPSRTRNRIDLAVCQARAGRPADAEAMLVRTAASANSNRAELWMRLGETRIVLGKLDEAIDALLASLDWGDGNNESARWLLVAAYDRARRPTEAKSTADDARRYDPQFTYIQSPRQPFLGAGDTEYLFGIAYRYAAPKPEYALLYFRRFLAIAPESMWKKRGEEHLRELGAMKFPARDTITSSGSAAVDVEQMRGSLAQAMPKLRACVAKTPLSAYQLAVTRVGPRSTQAFDRPLYRVPPADAKSTHMLSLDNRSNADPNVVDATKCLDGLAAKLKLPSPTERDTFYRLSYVVVSP